MSQSLSDQLSVICKHSGCKYDEVLDRVREAEVERDRYEGALREVYNLLRGGPDYHNGIGAACGSDACTVCLAESIAYGQLDSVVLDERQVD